MKDEAETGILQLHPPSPLPYSKVKCNVAFSTELRTTSERGAHGYLVLITSQSRFSRPSAHATPANRQREGHEGQTSGGSIHGLTEVIKAHDLPLTNLSFNKTGSHFITGSYDRTCKIWDAATGEEVRTLGGHTNVVYTVAFNLPVSDRIATGSFDKTVKLWDSESGECLHTLEGHSAEVVCLHFSSDSRLLATGSMDTTAKVWDLETGVETVSLRGHTAEVIALHFVGRDDRLLLTGSFDHSAMLWDPRTGRGIRCLSGHSAEVAAAACSFNGRHVATASMDKTLRVWDTRKGIELAVLCGHEDEVLDVTFDLSGRKLASASADATAILWSTDQPDSISELKRLEGHESEVSKVCFSPRGSTLMTASTDNSVRLWDTLTGELRDVLEQGSLIPGAGRICRGDPRICTVIILPNKSRLEHNICRRKSVAPLNFLLSDEDIQIQDQTVHEIGRKKRILHSSTNQGNTTQRSVF
ncbi:Dynein assembly factor with WDR repeat domain 1 [Taenia crassiceps]|uniref:Dynein assembly factor with WDR repeat domain 1 n=1 Tax=Taenia crassiceps TaxID=6207 RepID=A0ABR4Q6H7_9CEST